MPKILLTSSLDEQMSRPKIGEVQPWGLPCKKPLHLYATFYSRPFRWIHLTHIGRADWENSTHHFYFEIT